MRLSLLIALLLPALALAQESAPPEAAPSPALTELQATFPGLDVSLGDAREALASVAMTDGLQFLLTDETGTSLYASVLDGNIVDYVGLTGNGRVFGLQPVSTTTDGGACWACASGDVGVACWQIACTSGETEGGMTEDEMPEEDMTQDGMPEDGAPEDEG